MQIKTIIFVLLAILMTSCGTEFDTDLVEPEMGISSESLIMFCTCMCGDKRKGGIKISTPAKCSDLKTCNDGDSEELATECGLQGFEGTMAQFKSTR